MFDIILRNPYVQSPFDISLTTTTTRRIFIISALTTGEEKEENKEN